MNATVNPMIQQGVEFYASSKPEGDIDLVAVVRDKLKLSGLAQQLPDAYDNHHFVVEATGKRSEVQRYLLNRYWNLQLSMCPNSIDVRYSLIPNGHINEWLNLFDSTILPFIVENRLPRPIKPC